MDDITYDFLKRRSGSPSSLFALRERDRIRILMIPWHLIQFSVHCMQQYMVEHNTTRKCEKVTCVRAQQSSFNAEKARGDHRH